ncbi:acetoacetyl-synthase [Dactylonectria macrodidyma]|uniref:Acetoacetyl-synthase n=1 Tax=Dactylonectria macrodidyma TaxID=307937 RepID=A0A9P9EQL5_9HYPO|nr:acetoacetyl-synthase [Dactylonectria macrodidyma]
MSFDQKRPIWEPRDVSQTNVAKFMAYVNGKHGLHLQTYHDLHRWSVGEETFQVFWKDAYRWLQIAPGEIDDGDPVMSEKDSTSGLLFPPPQFFPNEMMNISELLLRNGNDEATAIHFAREGVPGIERVTWRNLKDRVREARAAMINSDIGPGDVVAAVMSNSVHAIVLCLATLSLGAVWSSSSPDLGPDGIKDRYIQVNPKIIFADDGYVYAGKLVELGSRIEQWSQSFCQGSNSLCDIVIIPYCNIDTSAFQIYRQCTYGSFLQRGTGQSLDFTMLPFSHPAFILYSSGTTGKPKCIVHSAGGVALKVKTDMILQHDIRKNDIVFQFTTTSWVMWVLNLVNLASGAGMLLYDGSPFHPTPTVLLKLAEEVGVSVFGTSPRYLSELRSRLIIPRTMFNLSKLRVVTSTGSALSADLYEWFYHTAFPPDAQLISMSGGTDIAGCFVGGTPILPVYSGEIQVKALGMAVDIFDSIQQGPSSIETTGASGELVCTLPFPSQPLKFYGQDGKKQYQSSYFDRFGPKVWCQGDVIQRFGDTLGLVMLGRSDGVLNPSGVRFGSAEIYAVVDKFPAIADSICVGQKRECDADERVILFVKMKYGSDFTDDLVKALKASIRETHTSRHVPRFIFEVTDIPYTVNGKKCELAVKHVVCGRRVAVSPTVANPDALKLYLRFADLPLDVLNLNHKL